MNITSPATGKIIDRTNNSISIFINPLNEHTVYSPINGKIYEIVEKGEKHYQSAKFARW